MRTERTSNQNPKKLLSSQKGLYGSISGQFAKAAFQKSMCMEPKMRKTYCPQYNQKSHLPQMRRQVLLKN